jgi:cation diffusion facilitator family transporter
VPEQTETTTTVVVAFAANLAIAIAKSVVAALSGSASLVAEAAHSWADTGNQVLLLVAERRSARPPDEERPLGYGREAYVWSLFAALGLFFAGGAVSVYHGIAALGSESEGADYTAGYVVLAVALCFEAVSFAQAYRQARSEARELGRDVLDHALATSDPTLRAVLAEDSAAVIGVLIAAAGLVLHEITGDARYDAAGSILVGLLLCGVGLVLIDRNRRFLTGEVASAGLHDAALQRLHDLPGIERVTRLRLEFLGPRQLLLVAGIDLHGDAVESDVAHRLRDLERELETNPRVVEAVLTLSTPEEPSLARPRG